MEWVEYHTLRIVTQVSALTVHTLLPIFQAGPTDGCLINLFIMPSASLIPLTCMMPSTYEYNFLPPQVNVSWSTNHWLREVQESNSPILREAVIARFSKTWIMLSFRPSIKIWMKQQRVFMPWNLQAPLQSFQMDRLVGTCHSRCSYQTRCPLLSANLARLQVKCSTNRQTSVLWQTDETVWHCEYYLMDSTVLPTCDTPMHIAAYAALHSFPHPQPTQGGFSNLNARDIVFHT